MRVAKAGVGSRSTSFLNSVRILVSSLMGAAVLTACAPVFATSVFIGVGDDLQAWSWNGASYIPGGSIGAVNPGGGHTIREIGVDPSSGKVFTQGTDQVMRAWSYNGGSFTSTGQVGQDGFGITFSATGTIYSANRAPDWIIKYSHSGSVFTQQGFMSLDAVGVGFDDATDTVWGVGNSVAAAWTDNQNGTFNLIGTDGIDGQDGAILPNGQFFVNADAPQWVATYTTAGAVTRTSEAGLDFKQDVAINSAGVAFVTQNSAQEWLSAWDTTATSAAVSLINFVGLGPAFVAIDSDDVVHTISEDGVLRAWNWDRVSGFSVLGQVSVGTATAIAVGPTVVPEPSSLLLAALGIIALLLRNRR
jgi:PEP-CTERM motif